MCRDSVSLSKIVSEIERNAGVGNVHNARRLALPGSQQSEAPVPAVGWSMPESESFEPSWGTEVVWNVAEPSLLPFAANEPNGSAIVIAPGGGFFGLSINSEGIDVARWLADRCGIHAYVLKYRTVPLDPARIADGDPPDAENRKSIQERAQRLATIDALAAVRYVREQQELPVDPSRIGFMGFSAGGVLALALATETDIEPCSRPDFVAPIYPRVDDPSPDRVLPDGCGPAFFVAAFDDELGFADDTLRAYRWWLRANIPAELHIYAAGGHGFGMRPAGLPRDTWIERFAEWFANTGFASSQSDMVKAP